MYGLYGAPFLGYVDDEGLSIPALCFYKSRVTLSKRQQAREMPSVKDNVNELPPVLETSSFVQLTPEDFPSLPGPSNGRVIHANPRPKHVSVAPIPDHVDSPPTYQEVQQIDWELITGWRYEAVEAPFLPYSRYTWEYVRFTPSIHSLNCDHLPSKLRPLWRSLNFGLQTRVESLPVYTGKFSYSRVTSGHDSVMHWHCRPLRIGETAKYPPKPHDMALDLAFPRW